MPDLPYADSMIEFERISDKNIFYYFDDCSKFVEQ